MAGPQDFTEAELAEAGGFVSCVESLGDELERVACNAEERQEALMGTFLAQPDQGRKNLALIAEALLEFLRIVPES